MPGIDNPYRKEALIATFKKANSEVLSFFSLMETENFFKKPGDAWSPAENLKHLILSVRPVVLALSIPKFILIIKFGKSVKMSRSFKQIKELYLSKLAKGAVAARRYIPPQKPTPTDVNKFVVRKKILQGWEKAGNSLIKALTKWQEKDLDSLQLPHPIIGKLSVREMLFFTLYHNQHHVNCVKNRLSDAVNQSHKN